MLPQQRQPQAAKVFNSYCSCSLWYTRFGCSEGERSSNSEFASEALLFESECEHSPPAERGPLPRGFLPEAVIVHARHSTAIHFVYKPTRWTMPHNLAKQRHCATTNVQHTSAICNFSFHAPRRPGARNARGWVLGPAHRCFAAGHCGARHSQRVSGTV